MSDPTLEAAATMALTEARITNMLLTEIVEVLEVKGLLSRGDIAGALLRMEFRAELTDAMNRDDGDITHHAAQAKLTIDEWESRFGLPSDLHTLRKAQKEWTESGSEGKSPLYPEQVIALYADGEE